MVTNYCLATVWGGWWRGRGWGADFKFPAFRLLPRYVRQLDGIQAMADVGGGKVFSFGVGFPSFSTPE